MCIIITYFQACANPECGQALDEFGRLRPCDEALKHGAFGDCDRGLEPTDVVCKGNMLCHGCLLARDGVNTYSETQGYRVST